MNCLRPANHLIIENNIVSGKGLQANEKGFEQMDKRPTGGFETTTNQRAKDQSAGKKLKIEPAIAAGGRSRLDRSCHTGCYPKSKYTYVKSSAGGTSLEISVRPGGFCLVWYLNNSDIQSSYFADCGNICLIFSTCYWLKGRKVVNLIPGLCRYLSTFKETMPRNIFQPLEIVTYDTEVLDCSPQADNYFELVFVEEGSGHRMLDDVQIQFHTGDLFMHIPGERNTILPGRTFPHSFYQVPADTV